MRHSKEKAETRPKILCTIRWILSRHDALQLYHNDNLLFLPPRSISFTIHPMRIITFDLETKNIFQDTGSNDPASLDVSVVGVHDSESNEYTAFLEKDFAKMWPLFETADAIVSFNGDHFDIPILNKYYHGDLVKNKKHRFDASGAKSSWKKDKAGHFG